MKTRRAKKKSAPEILLIGGPGGKTFSKGLSRVVRCECSALHILSSPLIFKDYTALIYWPNRDIMRLPESVAEFEALFPSPSDRTNLEERFIPPAFWGAAVGAPPEVLWPEPPQTLSDSALPLSLQACYDAVKIHANHETAGLLSQCLVNSAKDRLRKYLSTLLGGNLLICVVPEFLGASHVDVTRSYSWLPFNLRVREDLTRRARRVGAAQDTQSCPLFGLIDKIGPLMAGGWPLSFDPEFTFEDNEPTAILTDAEPIARFSSITMEERIPPSAGEPANCVTLAAGHTDRARQRKTIVLYAGPGGAIWMPEPESIDAVAGLAHEWVREARRIPRGPAKSGAKKTTVEAGEAVVKVSEDCGVVFLNGQRRPLASSVARKVLAYLKKHRKWVFYTPDLIRKCGYSESHSLSGVFRDGEVRNALFTKPSPKRYRLKTAVRFL